MRDDRNDRDDSHRPTGESWKEQMEEVEFGNYALDEQAYDIALKILIPAAEAGDIEALKGLAYAYAVGEGVEVDEKKAHFFIGKAAESGDEDATYLYGSDFEYGNCGAEKNLKLAYMWYSIGNNAGALAAIEKEMTTQEISQAQAMVESWLASHPNGSYIVNAKEHMQEIVREFRRLFGQFGSE